MTQGLPRSARRTRRAAPARCVLLVAALLALTGAAAALNNVDFLTLSIPLDGELLAVRSLDQDGDGRPDLVLAVLPDGTRRRELRVYRGRADGLLPLVPDVVVAVQPDVLAWTLADTRPDEPGLELVLLTRSGAFDYGTTRDGYRDNIRRLASTDLILQVPAPDKLPYLAYVLPGPDGARLLLPAASGPQLWGPRRAAPAGTATPDSATAADAWELLAAIVTGRTESLFRDDAPEGVLEARGQRRVTITSNDNGPWIGDGYEAFASMLAAESRYRAPALLDLDGDGHLDLVLMRERTLRVHPGHSGGLSAEPARIEPFPDWIPAGTELQFRLADLDGDGDLDLVLRSAPKSRGLDTQVFTFFLALNDGSRLLPERPAQVLRFEGNEADAEIVDVNGDGRPDMVVTKYMAPGLRQLVTGLRFERSAFVYRGGGRGAEPFERKPGLRDEQTFSIDTLADALVLRRVPGDLSGDGLADLLEVDLTGRLSIRRITEAGGLFGGGLKLEAAPWRRFELTGHFDRALIADLNGDGIADVLLPADRAVNLLLSRRAPGARR